MITPNLCESCEKRLEEGCLYFGEERILTFKGVTHDIIRDKSLNIIIHLTQKREYFTNNFETMEFEEVYEYFHLLSKIEQILGIEKE